jgi:acyl-CoA dehydrogenase
MTYQSPWMNDELHMFRKTVRRYIQEEFLPCQARWRQQRRPDAGAWTQAGAAGLLLTDVPEGYGGGGGNITHEAVIVEEMARAGVHFGSLNQSILAHYILAYGTEEQKQNWLPRMARGELVGAIAMTEPGAGSDLQGIKTSAVRHDDYFVVNGSKTFITNGAHASLIGLAVKTDMCAPGLKGISVIIVEPRDAVGYSLGAPLEKIGMHGQDTCELFFDGVRVPVGNLLGPVEGNGFGQMMSQLSYERLMVAVSAVATSEEAVRMTTKYVKERRAFGAPLLDLQNTRFKMAECQTACRIGRIFLDDCIDSFLKGRLDATTAAMAKYWLTDCECHVLDECLQLHGGYGYSTEYPIARMCADSRVHRIYAGANEVMKEIIGCSL